MKQTVLIVEDDDATRARLERAIREGGMFTLIGAVGFFNAASLLLHKQPPDILLTDLDLPDGNGVDLIKIQKQAPNDGLAVVITIFGDEGHVIKALKAGASGYLLKDDDFIEINNALKQMVDGGSPISPSIARYLLAEFSSPTQSEGIESQLSVREQEILVLVSKGYTSKEIGMMLQVSFHTVNAHVKNIYKKLSVTNKAEAIYEATRQGII
jgi:DNA-binding NarL/FixJ family response regulator